MISRVTDVDIFFVNVIIEGHLFSTFQGRLNNFATIYSIEDIHCLGQWLSHVSMGAIFPFKTFGSRREAIPMQ